MLLNFEGIDYYLSGALCGYIKYKEESKRIHDDIDICINEKDIDKFKKVCEKMGLKFSDNRFNSPRVLKNNVLSEEHEIIAETDNFYIGAFPFERLADGTIITKSYYHDSNNNSCCREDIISTSLASLMFDKKAIDFKGIPIYITTPEYIYYLKRSTNNNKDKIDREFLESRIDNDKVEIITKLSKSDKDTQFNIVSNKQPITNTDSNDTEESLYTTTDLEKDMKKATNKREFEKQNKEITRQLKKINPNTKLHTGSISIVSIILALLVVFAILLIGLIIYTIIK